MEVTYKCKHFKIHELVPPQVYKDRGEKAWELMDLRLLISIDKLRDEYGQATINNYEFGGNREWSGLRTPASPYYSPYSQHTFGRAADIIFKDHSAEDIRKDIALFPEDYPLINCIEEDVSWLHVDVRNCQRIKWFKPN